MPVKWPAGQVVQPICRYRRLPVAVSSSVICDHRGSADDDQPDAEGRTCRARALAAANYLGTDKLAVCAT